MPAADSPSRPLEDISAAAAAGISTSHGPGGKINPSPGSPGSKEVGAAARLSAAALLPTVKPP
jgi:hypothetical protein